MIEIPEHERPLSEQFRIVAKQHNKALAEYLQLEELKTPELEKRKMVVINNATGDDKMSITKAESVVKASDDWHDYCRALAIAKAKAALLADQKTYLRMRHDEERDANANNRAEMKMTGH